MSVEQLREFFGWCLLVNTVIIFLSVAILAGMKDKVISIHRRFFSISSEDLQKAYFSYLALYKILIICFNLTPYIVLSMMVN